MPPSDAEDIVVEGSPASMNKLSDVFLDDITSTDASVGLSSSSYSAALAKHGRNEVVVEATPMWKLFVRQFIGVMQLILVVCAVLSATFGDWTDFGIILGLVTINGVLAFREERAAMIALASLTASIESTVTVVRDGVSTSVNVVTLVPGDIILLIGGLKVPADVRWLKGDKMKIDTAALTGEPIPRTYPGEHGNDILGGTTVCEGEAYCQVLKTGEETEIGKASKNVFEDKNKKVISLFEAKIMRVVYTIIAASFVIVLIQFLIQGLKRDQFDNYTDTSMLIVFSLAVIVASIPIALPIVMQVTMAIGMKELGEVHRAVVTSVPALQDIASMSILCSDKTGTLTTAVITINKELVVASPDFDKASVLLYAAAAANPDKLGDPIDSAILRAKMSPHKEQGWTQDRSIGFSPITKRTVCFVTTNDGDKLVIAKGIMSKILDTSDGGVDDAELQWKVKDSADFCAKMKLEDEGLSTLGYKTISIAVSRDGGKSFVFVGVVPMLDPPRADTKKTIAFLHHANVSVKMITGDHRNIAIETGKLINLHGSDIEIHNGEKVRGEESSEETKKLIWDSDGFAQVLPSDKRKVVQVLRHDFGTVVGMTGDGVNDAPALSAAQVGIAVEGATDAAKNAAAIILTDPGLSPIYGAIVMSREIFRKVKSYVVYRIACSIFMVLTLCILVFVSACSVQPVLIILLALLNDISMLPIAYDHVSASRSPELPRARSLVIRALFFGTLATALAMVYFYTINPMQDGNENVFHSIRFEFFCTQQTSALVWLFLCILSESLIFTVRVPTGYFWQAKPPSIYLVASVLATDILVSLLAGVWKDMWFTDILITWAFGLASFLIIDVCKVFFFCTLLGEEAGSTITFQQFVEAADDTTIVSEPVDRDVEADAISAQMLIAKKARQSVHAKHRLTTNEIEGHKVVDSDHHMMWSWRSWLSWHGARHH
ncbi:hypothetical protein TrLO_g15595 [Triparma laevis f. longispina]|uniref:Cation-transporting P-type ATPase N-terminal domain-containing protein n=1 Tax=Triparma laevis f. longispina TaxID=1714387 RepID=A0A9W7FDM1_9STRA|nr:hypothetical protein TrLO_g15595 [Triparma laevis f. longispina]